MAAVAAVGLERAAAAALEAAARAAMVRVVAVRLVAVVEAVAMAALGVAVTWVEREEAAALVMEVAVSVMAGAA